QSAKPTAGCRAFWPAVGSRCQSEGAHLRGLRTLRPLGHAVLDLLVFFEAAVAIRLDRGEVNEDVTATVVGGDEAIALVRVEPLYGPLSHFCCMSFWKSLRPAHFTRISHDGCHLPNLGAGHHFPVSTQERHRTVPT